MKTTIKAKLLEMPSEESEKIDNLMLRFSSAIRFAFNRRKPDAYDPMNKGDLEKLLQSKYKLNSRYAKDAVMKADSIISSQKELVKEYHSNYKSKVKQVKQELKRAKSKQKIHALKTKLDKYQRKLEEYQKHLDEGTIPKVIFGGKENYKARCEGKISNQEWKELRNNKFCSRGDKTKKGNLNTRIVLDKEDNIFLRINTSVKKNSSRYEYIKVPLYLPQKKNLEGEVNGRDYKSMVLKAVNKEKSYYVEVIHKDNQYFVHITIEEKTPEIKSANPEQVGIIGIDTNPDGFALTCLDQEGNYKWHKCITNPELTSAKGNRRTNLCGELAKEVVEFIKNKGYSVAIEDLEFKRNSYGNKKFERISHQFVYRKLLTFLERGCKREGIEVIKVNPAFTSIIGKYKYQHQFGISVHNSAALVIGRRALGFNERIPKQLIQVMSSYLNRVKFTKFISSSQWSKWGKIDYLIKILIKNIKKKGGENPAYSKDYAYSRYRKRLLEIA